MDSNNIAAVGAWLHGILPPRELRRIIEHERRSVSPASDLFLHLEISLYELQRLQVGCMPDARGPLGFSRTEARPSAEKGGGK